MLTKDCLSPRGSPIASSPCSKVYLTRDPTAVVKVVALPPHDDDSFTTEVANTLLAAELSVGPEVLGTLSEDCLGYIALRRLDHTFADWWDRSVRDRSLQSSMRSVRELFERIRPMVRKMTDRDVHPDLLPKNIMFDADYEVRLIDWAHVEKKERDPVDYLLSVVLALVEACQDCPPVDSGRLERRLSLTHAHRHLLEGRWTMFLYA